MNGVEYQFGVFENQKWTVERLENEELLKEGETIIIGHHPRRLTHLAIYIGDGLYLSKGGTIGALIVADLPSMKIGFGGDEVYRASPALNLK